jgi:hypothetical protein
MQPLARRSLRQTLKRLGVARINLSRVEALDWFQVAIDKRKARKTKSAN